MVVTPFTSVSLMTENRHTEQDNKAAVGQSAHAVTQADSEFSAVSDETSLLSYGIRSKPFP